MNYFALIIFVQKSVRRSMCVKNLVTKDTNP